MDHQIGKAFFVRVTTVTPGGLRAKMGRFVVFGVSFVVAVVQFQRCTKIVLVLLFSASFLLLVSGMQDPGFATEQDGHA